MRCKGNVQLQTIHGNVILVKIVRDIMDYFFTLILDTFSPEVINFEGTMSTWLGLHCYDSVTISL